MLGELNARRCIHPPSIHASWHAVSSATSSSPHRAVDLARSITPSRRAPSPAPIDDVRAISLSVASRSTASCNGIVWCATPRSLSLPPPSAAEQPGTARPSLAHPSDMPPLLSTRRAHISLLHRHHRRRLSYTTGTYHDARARCSCPA
ncbi:hypothetical protein IEO21_10686 [Rhodonia placenta]|uniref:Uncharacterized protein n=1 Tax=Rhodonia placenta TaxID=104341 RepID=A0A8H7TX75_9APHY|nr:hypothetical protein IEO21_10686 [Postia placenta]